MENREALRMKLNEFKLGDQQFELSKQLSQYLCATRKKFKETQDQDVLQKISRND